MKNVIGYIIYKIKMKQDQIIDLLLRVGVAAIIFVPYFALVAYGILYMNILSLFVGICWVIVSLVSFVWGEDIISFFNRIKTDYSQWKALKIL